MTKMAEEYSLWLMPKGKVLKELSRIIQNLSGLHFRDYFDPHVTLIGKIKLPEQETIERTESLAKRLPRLDVRFGGFGFSDEFYHSLYVKITGSDSLFQANKDAQEMFGKNNGFDPHLSLFYGYLPEEEKERITGGIGSLEGLSFRASHTHLYLTKGRPKSWKKVGKFRFRG